MAMMAPLKTKVFEQLDHIVHILGNDQGVEGRKFHRCSFPSKNSLCMLVQP
jgi:hypothetical protein